MKQNLAVASGIFLLLPLRVFRNMTIFAVGNLNYTMYKIIQAEYAGDYKILITFDDGQKRLADFYGFISKSLHPSIHKYIDKTLFQQFEFDNYGIHWGTQFDIDPYDIYYGEFEAKDSPYYGDIEASKTQYELVEEIE